MQNGARTEGSRRALIDGEANPVLEGTMLEILEHPAISNILDRFLLGGLLLFCGFVLNGWLEKSKARSALVNEIAKQRVVYVAEAWTAMYEAQLSIEEVFRAALPILTEEPRDEVRLKESVGPLQRDSMKKMDRAVEIIRANQFWLGEEMYNRLRKFNDLLVDHVRAFEEANAEKLERLLTKIKENRMSIVGFVEDVV